MGTRTEKTVLQILTKSIVDCQSHDQGSDPRRHAGDGNAGNDANHRLAPFGAKVARGDKKFEAHRSYQLSAISFQPHWIIARDAVDFGNRDQ